MRNVLVKDEDRMVKLHVQLTSTLIDLLQYHMILTNMHFEKEKK